MSNKNKDTLYYVGGTGGVMNFTPKEKQSSEISANKLNSCYVCSSLCYGYYDKHDKRTKYPTIVQEHLGIVGHLCNRCHGNHFFHAKGGVIVRYE